MPRGLAARIVGYVGLADTIPFYAYYQLLFADAGLLLAEISALFALWSLTAVVLEVPSGAWADVVPRRLLLALAGVLHAAAFATWILFPGWPGFALGFVLWGAGSSLVSGTLEALVYDELAAVGAESGYARLIGRARSAATLGILLATFLAAPLYAVGGYALVAWTSVAVALVQAGLGLSLPAAPPATEADEIDAPDARPTDSLGRRYRLMLRDGLHEATRVPVVRRVVLLTAVIYGLNTHDEYFALVGAEAGAAAVTIAVLVGITSVGEAVGTALAGRTVGWSSRALAALLAAAGVLFVVGALSAGWQGGWLGFVLLGLASGIHNNLIVVAEARQQEAIEGRARATVTSVGGLLTELVALATFAVYAAGSAGASVSVLVALMGLPLIALAVLVPRALPARRRDARS